jgi:S1-C subfamily serine protease
MRGLIGKAVLAAAGAGLVVAAVAVTGVLTPVRAQDQGLRRLEQADRVQVIDAFGGSIGVNVRDVSPEEAQRAKLSPPQGAYVTNVHTGSPAEKAGIMTGDIIAEFDGERVRSARQLSRLVRESADDRAVRVAIVRDGARRTVDLTPTSSSAWFTMPDLSGVQRKLEDAARNFEFRYDGPGGRGFGQWIGPGGRARLGASLSSVGDQLAVYFGVKGGALVTSVEMDSPADRAGLKAGDVTSDVLQEVRRAADGGALEMTVTRDRKEVKLSAKLPERERPAVRTGRSI